MGIFSIQISLEYFPYSFPLNKKGKLPTIFPLLSFFLSVVSLVPLLLESMPLKNFRAQEILFPAPKAMAAVPQQAQPDRAVELTDFKGLVVNGDGSSIEKLSTFCGDWDASAASVHGIGSAESGTKGISFVPLQTNKSFMCGLTSGAADAHSALAGSQCYTSIDFAAYAFANGQFLVWEDETFAGTFGHYKADDLVEVVLNAQSKIEFRVNGQVRYVSQKEAKYPLFAKISACSGGCFLHRLEWVGARPFSLSQDEARMIVQERDGCFVALATANHRLQSLERQLAARNLQLQQNNRAPECHGRASH